MQQESQVNKRAQNKEKLRQNLIKEATALFSEKGLDETTVADIVMACDIGRGTFYNYFKDVKDIFNAVVDEISVEIGKVTKEARSKGTTVYDILYRSFKAYFELVSSPRMKGFHDKNQAYIRSASYKSDTIRNIVRDLKKELDDVSSQNKFNSDKSLQLLTYVLVGAPAELFLNNMSVNKTFNNHEVASFLAELFTNGMLTDGSTTQKS